MLVSQYWILEQWAAKIEFHKKNIKRDSGAELQVGEKWSVWGSLSQHWGLLRSLSGLPQWDFLNDWCHSCPTASLWMHMGYHLVSFHIILCLPKSFYDLLGTPVVSQACQCLPMSLSLLSLFPCMCMCVSLSLSFSLYLCIFVYLCISLSLSLLQKNFYFCFIDYTKAFDCVDHNKLENSERDGNTRPPDLPLEKSVYRSGSNS